MPPGLPNSRFQTFSPADPIPSALLNNLQDCVIGGKRDYFATSVHGFAFNIGTGFAPSTVGKYALSSGVCEAYASVQMTVGDRIAAISAAVYGDGVLTNQIGIYKTVNGVTNLLTGLFASAVSPAGWSELAVSVGALPGGFMVVPGESYYLLWKATAAGARLSRFDVTFDRP